MNEDILDRIQQGVELMAAQRFEAAKSVFSEVLEKDRKNFDAYLHLGNACVNLGQTEEGIAAFKKAQLLKPDSDEIVYSLGCAHFILEKYSEAVKYFNQCEERGFVSVELYGLMEIAFLDARDYVQAIRYANKAIQLEPLNPQPYLDKAQLYLLDGKPNEAVSCLREVEGLLPDAGEPYVVEFNIFMQTEEYDQALAVMEKALARFPQDSNMMVLKAKALNSLGRYAEASALLTRADELIKESPELARESAMQQSIAQLGLKDVDASIEVLRKVTKENPSDAEALFLLTNECFSAERYEDTLESCDQLLALEDIEARFRASGIFWRASSLKKLGRDEEASKAFREATVALRQINIGEPGLIEVYIYRALSHKELGEFERALKLVDHVINFAPDDAVGYAFKSDIYKAQGDEAQAQKLREKVLTLNPSFEF